MLHPEAKHLHLAGHRLVANSKKAAQSDVARRGCWLSFEAYILIHTVPSTKQTNTFQTKEP
jgi:hypothetical protein